MIFEDKNLTANKLDDRFVHLLINIPYDRDGSLSRDRPMNYNAFSKSSVGGPFSP